MDTTLDKLNGNWAAGRFVCLGLDPQIGSIPQAVQKHSPAETIIAFNRAIIEVTSDLVAAYKPNVAFYERYGAEGHRALEVTIRCIRDHNPKAVIIVDAKRADIGNTNSGYVDALFDLLGADATTLNPYLGEDALSPFLEREDKFSFILCRTSNRGAGEFQDLDVNGERLFEHVARRVADVWNKRNNLGLVIGATSPRELSDLRERVPRLPLLIPGVGAQGGDVDEVIRSVRAGGPPNVLINSSRAILYADNSAEFATRARQVAMELGSSLAEGLSDG